MIEDYNESVTFQPVSINHVALHDSMNGTPFHRPDLNPLSLHVRIERRMFLPTEIRDDMSFSRPRQYALQSSRQGPRCGGPGQRSSTTIFQFAEETVDARG